MSVIAIIQCRLNSQRFPRKALASLDGRPVIVHVVERALQIPGVDRVIVATPWSDAALIAQELDEHERLSVFAARVDDADVLSRFVGALANYPDCDTVLRITGDTPLLQPDVAGAVLRLYQTTDCEYAWTNTHDGPWVDGLDVEAMARAALERAHAEATSAADREHVTSYIRRECTVAELPFDPRFSGWPKCSIDASVDIEVVREMLSKSCKISGVGTC